MNLAQTIDIESLPKQRASWLAAIAQINGEPARVPSWIAHKRPPGTATVRKLEDDENSLDGEELA